MDDTMQQNQKSVASECLMRFKSGQYLLTYTTLFDTMQRIFMSVAVGFFGIDKLFNKLR